MMWWSVVHWLPQSCCCIKEVVHHQLGAGTFSPLYWCSCCWQRKTAVLPPEETQTLPPLSRKHQLREPLTAALMSSASGCYHIRVQEDKVFVFDINGVPPNLLELFQKWKATYQRVFTTQFCSQCSVTRFDWFLFSLQERMERKTARQSLLNLCKYLNQVDCSSTTR